MNRYWVRKHLLPRWGKLKAGAITRADVRAAMIRIEAPILTNQVLAAASAIFSWAIRQEIVAVNPCRLVDRNPTTDRSRVLSDAEVKLLWPKLDPALRLILLTGQRGGEVSAMQREHITDGWVDAARQARGQVAGDQERPRSPGLVVGARAGADRGAPRRGVKKIERTDDAGAGRRAEDRACYAPHDLRRTALTTITRLGFGRDAMDRIANHRTSTVTDVYDRHSYADEDRRIMAAVARHVLEIAEGREASNVVNLR
jgi:integrase